MFYLWISLNSGIQQQLLGSNIEWAKRRDVKLLCSLLFSTIITMWLRWEWRASDGSREFFQWRFIHNSNMAFGLSGWRCMKRISGKCQRFKTKKSINRIAIDINFNLLANRIHLHVFARHHWRRGNIFFFNCGFPFLHTHIPAETPEETFVFLCFSSKNNHPPWCGTWSSLAEVISWLTAAFSFSFVFHSALPYSWEVPPILLQPPPNHGSALVCVCVCIQFFFLLWWMFC